MSDPIRDALDLIDETRSDDLRQLQEDGNAALVRFETIAAAAREVVECEGQPLGDLAAALDQLGRALEGVEVVAEADPEYVLLKPERFGQLLGIERKARQAYRIWAVEREHELVARAMHELWLVLDDPDVPADPFDDDLAGKRTPTSNPPPRTGEEAGGALTVLAIAHGAVKAGDLAGEEGRVRDALANHGNALTLILKLLEGGAG